MTSFEDECVSLGLSVQKDGMKSILDNEKGEEIHDCLFAVAPNNDHDTTFYCASNLSGDERSVIMNSKFEPDMKNSTKTVFLVKKKDESHHNDYNLDENCSSDSNKNADDDDVAREILEYGRLADNKALSSVFVLDNVVLPLLRQGILSKKSIQESNLRSSLHLTYAKKFASRVCRFTEQYERGTRLVVPDNLDMTSFNELREEFSDLKSLEKAAIEWIASIAHVMESEINQPLQKDVKGPMAEVDFWRRRHVVFSDILEQVKNVKIKSSLEVLRVAGSPVCGKLQEKVNDLTKLSVEATENAKFLSTLERHLRTLNDGTLDAIIPTIPSLVDGMRMVWSVSRHYNRDERMVPLMEMVANQVILRVKERVKLHEIMQNQIDESRDVVSKSKKVLKIWRSSYMETRARIEKMGPGQRRWEFDRTRLFEITDYMADICTDVLQVIETIDELKHFLGPDLVSITGENGRVFTVMEEVKLLPKLFKDFQLDPFERSNGKDWSKIMETFNKMVQSIEEDAGESIQTAFRQLRSSVGAYHLVQQFGYMKSRPSIHRIIEQRYQDIFQQYEKESEQIEDYFLKYKDDPPISTGHQKAPGSIAWADGLYLRAKRPILLFQKHGSLLNDGLGLKVKNNYLKFARSIDSYKEHVYHNWQERARLVSYQCLRRPLLKVLGDDQSEANSQRTGSTKTCLHQPSDNTMPSSIQVPSDYSMQLNSHEKHSNSVSTVSVSTRIQTNFSNSVRILIDETKHFDAMGYSVPEGAMHLTLQEQTFNCHVIDLSKLAQIFNATFDSMSSLEMSLMEIHVNDMNKVLSPGFTTLYWSSQRISAYIAVAFHALEKFRSTLGEVRKHSSSIENIIKQIEQESLIDIDSDFALNSLGDFTDAIEDSVRRKVSKSMLQYKSIKPLLIKIEMAVSESDKGFSTLLESSYNYWTKRVYNALVQMTCRSTFSLFMMLRAFHTKSTQCHLNITVYDKEVIMEPSLSEIQKYFGRCFRTLTEASRQFFRWMSQTCLNATSSLESGDSLGLEHRYSFYRDVSQNSAIVSSFTGLNYGLQLLTRDLNAYLQYWKIIFKDYDIFDSGWKMELDNGIQSNIPASLFDHNINECERKLLHFRSLAFGKSDLVVNLCQHLCIFRLVDTTEVKRFLVDAINERKLDVGDVLHTEGKQNLESIQEAIESYRGILCSEPGSLHELKTVIKGIARIQNSNMQMELQCKDLCDKYNVLRGRDIFVPQEEMSQAFASYSHWHNLLIHAKTINLQLTDFKNDFKHRLTRQSADFKSKLKLEITRYHEEGPGCSTISLDQGLIKFDEWKTNLVRLKSIKEDLADSEDVLGMTNTPYADFIAIENSMYELTQIYDLYKDLNEVFQMQRTIAWLNVDIDSFRTKLDVLVQQSENIRIECNRPTWDKVHSRIIDLKDTIPILRNLQNDSFKDRHWEQLGEITKSHSQPLLKNLTLFDILTMNLHRIPSEVDEVLNSSLQEQKIQNGLFLIIDYWASANLLTKEYTGDTSGNFILSSMDDTVIQLEDHLLNLQAMLGSKFSGVFRDDIKRWEKRLNLIIECLNLWFKLQQKWMYLESIFIGAEDIRMQLQKETKIFDETSRGFQLIMKKTNEIPNIVNACSQERLLTFTKLLEVLESCQKSLSEYLNTKRAAFARFYFISDEEMISILGNSDPSSIEPHLLKLFDNTKTLMFSQGHRKITGLKSSEGESVQLIHDVDSIGPVEVWMQHFEDEIKHTLHSKMKESTFYYATQSRETWIKSNLGMCTISSSQVWWTWQVEDAFSLIESGDKQALQKLETKLSTQLSDMVAMVRSSLNDNTRRKVNSLLITDVHARDIVSSFVRESVLSAKEFEWESQLRFYWKKDHDDLMIQQCIGSFHYGYEYLGLCARLVITPLTDRCYMTLTQALTFKLGGSPSGPAGTGKTESVKDLAKYLGVPCFVVNCGEGLDYLAMASTFAGLLQSGAWGCFDEFNRINIEVLSVVSSQLKSMQNAFISDFATVNIGVGLDIPIKKVKGYAMCGVFITMNPGYAGRTELPDNLKSLFRPVAMVTPDIFKITENMLFSEGFLDSRSLARKVVTLYDLSKQQLSKQYHYDFGLRSMKAVLIMAGKTKRRLTNLPEAELMMLVLRNANMSKFIYEDVSLFLGFIKDLFPGIKYPEIGHDSLASGIRTYLTQNFFNCCDEEVMNKQVDKVVQLHETQKTRHSTMLVGPTCGGKSTVLQTLVGARRISDGTTIKLSIINPKAQELNELYGSLDVLTRDWTDGILPDLFRRLNQPLPAGRLNEERWIIFDGDVDAIWVENLNSVMDDNRLLTLPNGERIRLQPHCSLICEVYDLQYASPATVSRCGMVFVDPKNLGYIPFYERWYRLRYRELKKNTLLMQLFVKYAEPSIEYILYGKRSRRVEEKLDQVVPVESMELCKQLCNFLHIFLPSPKKEVDHDIRSLTNVYMYCILFGVGGRLTVESRIRFVEFLLELSDTLLPKCNLFEYFFCMDTKEWHHLDTKVHVYQEPSPFCFYKVFVPTKTSILYQELLQKLSTVCPILLVGDSGTGKTVISDKFVSSLSEETYSSLKINMSSMTKSSGIKSFLDSKIEKRVGSMYGAPLGKKLVVFIDDMHMPQIDQYGTRQPIALINTLLDHGFYHSCEKDIQQKFVKGVQMVGTMTPSSGGNYLDPRLMSKFTLLHLAKPTEEELHNIFVKILENRAISVCGSLDGRGEIVKKIVCMSLDLFAHLSGALQASPTKFHYMFTLRDLARVFEGLCTLDEQFYNDTTLFIRFWRNEVHRVFFDRLISEDDLYLTDGILTDIIERAVEKQDSNEIMKIPMLFLDFDKLCVGDKNYGRDQEIESTYSELQEVFVDVINNYNNIETQQTCSLVLFDFAIDHLLRILRVLKYPRGHVLLVGIGGSGKKSLTRLATHALGYSRFEVEIKKGYSLCDFCIDLKEVLKLSCSGPLVFLLPDEHIVSDRFLEYVSYILNIGIPPGLFEKDEIETLCHMCKCDEKSIVDICMDNLHVVLAMSPSGNTLRLRCRSFPTLTSACTIDWFFPWPKEALKMVARHVLTDDADLLPKLNIDKISNHMVGVHETVGDIAQQFSLQLKRRYQTTPKMYIDYLSSFKILLCKSVDKNVTLTKRLEDGLAKLSEASDHIHEMKIQLNEKKIFVDNKTEDVEQLISSIQEKQQLAEKSSQEASRKQIAAEEQGKTIKIEKDKADAALMEALPAVEAAAEALNNIRREDLQELKAFNNPPVHVKIVCQICTILRPTGEKLDETWGDSKKMLGNAKLLDLLKDYPKESLTEKMYQRCKKILRENKKHEMTIENMSTKSQAGKGLLVWVLAILRYYEVARNVIPLKDRVKEMQKAQAKTERELNELTCLLKTLDAELHDLRKKYDGAKNELSELQLQAAQMQRRLVSASSLIDGLKGEQHRWKIDKGTLEKDYSLTTGNSLLFAAFQSYFGAFNDEFRQNLIKQVMNDLQSRHLSYNEEFKPEDLLLSKLELQTWVGKGLSKDSYSIQNGLLTMLGSRFPLCIDPQEQAFEWIKKCFESSQLIVKSMEDRDYIKHLELAIEFGNPFIFQNVVEDLDPILENVLNRTFILENGKKKVMIGDKAIEWDDNFRLYLCTKMNNPSYTPEIMSKINIVNYSVTRDGLADQLLNIVINNERPELELQYQSLVNIMSSNMTMLTQLEDSLLRELASSSGNILDNASLITTLEKTRENASTIKKKIEECNQTKQVIEEARSSYKTVAQRGSTLYFASSGLTSINNMYELSLRTFIEQFAFALQNADKSDTCASRLKNLIASCTHRLYQFTCIGIFEQHRLTYALNLACMIMEESNDFDSALMNFFIKGNTFLGSTTQTKPPSLTFISNHAWELLSCIADKNRNLTDLKAQIVHEPSQFQGWIESDTPELTQPPHGKETCLSKSETLCLLRIFRPDRCYIATKLFIIDKVGKGFVESPTLNYREVYAQSTSAKPIIFILSKGADPQANIQNLGEQIGFPSPQKLSFVSLGQGQGPMAQRTLETAFIRGHWIMIQNCHLLIHWIDELESRLATLGKPHKDFRLWLTTEPSNLFPLGLLQNSYKVVIEPPDDMKLNMQSILNNFDQTVLDGCPHPLFPPLLYSLTFLHAVLQERQKYGKLGWNVPYDFNESDFTISRQLVSTYLSNAWADGNDLIPWETLKYLVGNAMYGGRVSDDMDRRILTAYFDEYFGDFLLCDGQKFHFSTLHETYTVPNVESGKLDEYICHVNYMPSTTKPAVLGLHCSADLKYFTDRMQDVWDSVAMCQVHSTGNAVDLSKDQHILSTAAEILKKVPISKPDIGTFDLNIVRKQLCDRCEDKKSLSPCAVVLLQELYHWNQLCISMFNSLQLLIKALKGETGMTDHLDETADSLNEGRLPHMWIMLAPSTTKNLQSWMSHFTRRHEQYVKWIEAGQPNVVWLSGLHFPQSFLSALLQTTCQKNGWALDETILHTEVTKVVEKNSQNTDTFDNGTYVEGLYLEGATWDVKNSKLTHQQNNDATTELPIIKIIPIQKKKVIAQKSLRTPVYLTKSRRSAKGEGLVFEAFLNTDIHHSFWILQGVAIIMNLD